MPDTGAPGIATRRERNRSLEAPSVAPYEKTLNGWEPTSLSSTNPAFCSFPTSPRSRYPSFPQRPAEKSGISSVSIPDFTWTASLPMHQNSIRLNIFGIKPIVLSSKLHQEPCRNYTVCFAVPSRRHDDHKNVKLSGAACPCPLERLVGRHSSHLLGVP